MISKLASKEGKQLWATFRMSYPFQPSLQQATKLASEKNWKLTHLSHSSEEALCVLLHHHHFPMMDKTLLQI
jgi:hypothetical protein